MEAKEISASAIEDQNVRIFPDDLNANNTVFGGMVMAHIDRVASIVAERHANSIVVTASVDSVHFHKPAHGGEVLVFKAAVNRTWRSSMEIGVQVHAVNYRSKEERHIVSAYLTFVSLDAKGQPQPIAPIIPRTLDQQRRYAAADARRTIRKEEATKHNWK